MTDAANLTPVPAAAERRGARADAIVRVLAIVTLAGVGVQFLLAGAGAFGESFDPHVLVGRALGWWTLLLVVAVPLARAGRADIVIAVVLAVLALPGQFLFAALGREASGWFGTLHVLNGVAIAVLAHRLMQHANRRRRLRQQQG